MMRDDVEHAQGAARSCVIKQSRTEKVSQPRCLKRGAGEMSEISHFSKIQFLRLTHIFSQNLEYEGGLWYLCVRKQ